MRSAGSAARLERGSVVISATNGKTTTAAMVSSIMRRTGATLVHNRAGANMAGGVAAALAGAARRGGRELDGDLGLFEVDEFWLGAVVEELDPRAMLLGNLFRDQLDRYGELETIADRWAAHRRRARPGDDPRAQRRRSGDRGPRPHDAAGLLRRRRRRARPARAPARVGLQALPALRPRLRLRRRLPRPSRPLPLPELWAAAGPSRPCGPPTSSCAGSPPPRSRCTPRAGERRIELPLPGLYNVYNALAAAALTLSLGAGLDDVAAGLAAVEPAFGRAETLDLGGRPTSILLVKNPAGANEVLRTLALEGEQLDLFGVLNDRTADGRDISWVWDADWEVIAPHVRRMTCSGTRAAELALRLKYAGVDAERLAVVEDIEAGLDRALADGDGPLYAVPTYTALLELRDLLTRRGQVEAYWR